MQTGLPAIEVTRVKNRLLDPTDGGWADIMINFKIHQPPRTFEEEGKGYLGTQEMAVAGVRVDKLSALVQYPERG